METPELDITKIIKATIGDVRPNSWNPKYSETSEYFKIRKSIKTNGLRGLIPVRNNNGFEIIDGQQRYTAAKELGYTHIYVYDHGEVSDQEAQELTIWYQVQAPFQKDMLSALVREMEEKYEHLNLPYSDKELADLLKTGEPSLEVGNTPTFGDDEVRTFTLVMAKEKYDLIVGVLTEFCDDNEMDHDIARALELILAEYRAGH